MPSWGEVGCLVGPGRDRLVAIGAASLCRHDDIKIKLFSRSKYYQYINIIDCIVLCIQRQIIILYEWGSRSIIVLYS